MAPRLIIGCCGWSYLREQECQPLLTGKNSSRLQAYARLFDSVEVSSTFYRIPRIIAYFRLHGFGNPSMYNYDFSRTELGELRSIVSLLPETLRAVYVYFNNVYCYTNGRDFAQLVKTPA